MNKWKSLKSAHVKRLLGCTLALGLLAGAVFGSTLSGLAADKVDLTAACNLTILSTSSTDKDYLADLEKADVVMDLYKVADAKEAEKSDGYEFEVTDGFKASVVIPGSMDSKTWSDLAQTAAAVIKASVDAGTPIVPDITVAAGQKIDGMAAGLYLILGRGAGLTDYFETKSIKSLDADGNEVVTSSIATLAYGYENIYSFAPEFVSLPTKEPDPVTGVIDANADKDWIYGAKIYMKPTSEPRYGELRIIKDLRTYETWEPAYFIFDVEAVKKTGDTEKKVFSNIYTLEFTQAGENYLLVENIPVGSEVTVTEVYSGAAYTLVSEPEQTVTIRAEEVVSVSFVNDYPNRRRHGGAITNHFDPELDETGNVILDDNGLPSYVWSKFKDSTEEVARIR